MLAAGVNVLTGGTDVHLVLADLRDSELDGQQAEDRLHEVGITVNRNAVPFDPRPPAVSSGLRIGTPALATRGFQADDFREVGKVIAEALTGDFPDAKRAELSERTRALAERYPLYPQLAAPLPFSARLRGPQVGCGRMDELDALWAFLVAAAALSQPRPPSQPSHAGSGAVHQPRARDLHDKPVPRLGGLAILVGGGRVGRAVPARRATTRAILAGAIAIALVGALDDYCPAACRRS